MQKIWRIKPSDASIQKKIAAELKVSNVTAQLLANRGITDLKSAADFMGCSLASCHDPILMKDMEKAVGRIRRAISQKEKILIYGDYDVDGMTSVAMVYSALKGLGADASYYIPNRIEEGYGLNTGAIKRAHREGVNLIITVDCGITSFKEIDYAKSANIDVVVTDHHEILEGRIPNAYAVVNPLQKDCSYPFKHLAGVGIAYKLVKALYDGTTFLLRTFSTL